MMGKEKLIITKEVIPIDKDPPVTPLNKGIHSDRKMPEVSKVLSPSNLTREENTHPHPRHKLAI